MFDDWLEPIDRIMKQRSFSKDALSSYRRFVGMIREVEPKLPNVEIQEQLKSMKKREGFPLFSRTDLPLDFTSSSELFRNMLHHLADSDRKDKEGIRKAMDQTKKDPEWPDKIFRAVLQEDHKALSGMGKTIEVDTHVLQFLAQTAMKPSLYALRQSLSERLDKKEWDYGYCPLCGSRPNMS